MRSMSSFRGYLETKIKSWILFIRLAVQSKVGISMTPVFEKPSRSGRRLGHG